MPASRVQTLRSNVAGNRPPGGQSPGTLYVNWPDAQLGVVNAAAANQDLIAVRFFSASTSYTVGQYTWNAGQLYRANTAISPGAFNATQWDAIATQPYVASQAPVTIGDNPPATPPAASLWWDSVGGQLYIRYGTNWVIAVNQTPQFAPPTTGTGPNYVLQGSPTITSPTITGTIAGSPTINTPTISGAAVIPTITGPTTINGNVTQTGNVTLSGNQLINQNSVAPMVWTPTPALEVTAAPNTIVAMFDGWGNGATIGLRAQGGTPAAPTAMPVNAILASLNSYGWNGSGWNSSAAINYQTTEAWTATANGAEINFFVTPNGAKTSINAAQFSAVSAAFTTPLSVTNTTGAVNSGTAYFAGLNNDDCRVYLNATGGREWLIGVGSPSSPAYPNKFYVYDWTGGVGRLTIDTNGTMVLAGALQTNGTVQSGSGYQARSGTPGPFQANVVNIDWNGAAHLWIDNVNQGALAFTSDYRIKKDVADLPSMWETAKRLRPIKYTQAEYDPPGGPEHKDEDGKPIPMYPADDIERWGFVAHELQETLTSSAATGVKDQPDLIQSPNPYTLLACVTKALQEVITRIEALEGAR